MHIKYICVYTHKSDKLHLPKLTPKLKYLFHSHLEFPIDKVCLS